MIWQFLGRVIKVFFGFGLALIAGAVVLFVLGGQIFAAGLSDQYGEILNPSIASIAGIISFIGALYPALTILPSVIAVVIGEIGHIRSMLYYLVAGGLSASAIPIFYVLMDSANFSLPSQAFMAAFATSGFAGGLVYWLIAGRTA